MSAEENVSAPEPSPTNSLPATFRRPPLALRAGSAQKTPFSSAILYNLLCRLIVSLIMEPLPGFLALISMLRIFKQERGERKKADRQAFMEWLEYHRHEDLKNFIANTAAVRAEVDNLMAADHALIIEKLDAIEQIVATLSSRVDEFRGLALTVVPAAQLSEQAVWILRQFVDSGDETLLYISAGSGRFALQTDNSEPFSVTDPRFLKSDFEQLVGLGLLTGEHNMHGNLVFRLTRNAVRYLEAIDSKPTSQEQDSSPKFHLILHLPTIERAMTER